MSTKLEINLANTLQNLLNECVSKKGNPKKPKIKALYKASKTLLKFERQLKVENLIKQTPKTEETDEI